MPKNVMHVDDMYRHDKNDFASLRNQLEKMGFKLETVAEFDDAAREYQRKHFPEVIIMDIMDEDTGGIIVHRGVATAEEIEDENQPSPQSPCIIYYTGVEEDDPSIQRIKDRNPYALIVFKRDNRPQEAERIYSLFPESLRA